MLNVQSRDPRPCTDIFKMASSERKQRSEVASNYNLDDDFDLILEILEEDEELEDEFNHINDNVSLLHFTYA